MKVSCVEIKSTGALEPVEAEDAVARWRAGEGAFWIDVESYRRDQLDAWLDSFDLQPFAKKLCLDIGETTQLIPLPDYVFLEVTVFSDGDFEDISNIGAICLKDLLITMHPAPIHTIEAKRRSIGELGLKDFSTSTLLILLLLLQAKEAEAATRAVRATLNAMDKAMDQDPSSVSLDEILDAKEAVSKALDVSEEGVECFEVLAAAKTEALDFSGLGGSIQQLISTARSVNRRADRLETQVADLRQRYEMYQQDKTNHRLAMLTVISAVFLPLSLLAGIWGMNFTNMPELHTFFGYPLALGLMVLIGGSLTWLFYKRGWFD